jgi:hypothetical protein
MIRVDGSVIPSLLRLTIAWQANDNEEEEEEGEKEDGEEEEEEEEGVHHDQRSSEEEENSMDDVHSEEDYRSSSEEEVEGRLPTYDDDSRLREVMFDAKRRVKKSMFRRLSQGDVTSPWAVPKNLAINPEAVAPVAILRWRIDGIIDVGAGRFTVEDLRYPSSGVREQPAGERPLLVLPLPTMKTRILAKYKWEHADKGESTAAGLKRKKSSSRRRSSRRSRTSSMGSQEENYFSDESGDDWSDEEDGGRDGGSDGGSDGESDGGRDNNNNNNNSLVMHHTMSLENIFISPRLWSFGHQASSELAALRLLLERQSVRDSESSGSESLPTSEEDEADEHRHHHRHHRHLSTSESADRLRGRRPTHLMRTNSVDSPSSGYQPSSSAHPESNKSSLRQNLEAAARTAAKQAELRTKKQRPTSILISVQVSNISVTADCNPTDEDVKLWLTNRDQPVRFFFSFLLFFFSFLILFLSSSLPLSQDDGRLVRRCRDNDVESQQLGVCQASRHS